MSRHPQWASVDVNVLKVSPSEQTVISRISQVASRRPLAKERVFHGLSADKCTLFSLCSVPCLPVPPQTVRATSGKGFPAPMMSGRPTSNRSRNEPGRVKRTMTERRSAARVKSGSSLSAHKFCI